MKDYNANEIFPAEILERLPALVHRNHYCIQLHDARRLHYDLRLHVTALGGTLSWAVPRGLLDMEPGERRLAVQTPVHPQSYTMFEGKVQGGQPVVLWDVGTYETTETGYETSDSDDDEEEGAKQERLLQDAFKKGNIKVWLRGVKLQSYKIGLVLPKANALNVKKEWLLLSKSKPVVQGDGEKSILTGKTLMDLRGQRLLDEFFQPAAGAKRRRESSDDTEVEIELDP